MGSVGEVAVVKHEAVKHHRRSGRRVGNGGFGSWTRMTWVLLISTSSVESLRLVDGGQVELYLQQPAKKI